jgi:preprotein translocase subunit YajC
MPEHKLFLTFAQREVPTVTDDAASQPGTTNSTGANGAADPAGAATSRPSGGPDLMLLIMLMVVAMLIFTVWGSRRERKKREAIISAVKKHDRVQTIGGVIGSVVEVKPDYIVLKVDESSNTRITFARSAVQQVLTVSPAANGGTLEKAE